MINQNKIIIAKDKTIKLEGSFLGKGGELPITTRITTRDDYKNYMYLSFKDTSNNANIGLTQRNIYYNMTQYDHVGKLYIHPYKDNKTCYDININMDNDYLLDISNDNISVTNPKYYISLYSVIYLKSNNEIFDLDLFNYYKNSFNPPLNFSQSDDIIQSLVTYYNTVSSFDIVYPPGGHDTADNTLDNEFGSFIELSENDKIILHIDITDINASHDHDFNLSVSGDIIKDRIYQHGLNKILSFPYSISNEDPTYGPSYNEVSQLDMLYISYLKGGTYTAYIYATEHVPMNWVIETDKYFNIDLIDISYTIETRPRHGSLSDGAIIYTGNKKFIGLDSLIIELKSHDFYSNKECKVKIIVIIDVLCGESLCPPKVFHSPIQDMSIMGSMRSRNMLYAHNVRIARTRKGKITKLYNINNRIQYNLPLNKF